MTIKLLGHIKNEKFITIEKIAGKYLEFKFVHIGSKMMKLFSSSVDFRPQWSFGIALNSTD